MKAKHNRYIFTVPGDIGGRLVDYSVFRTRRIIHKIKRVSARLFYRPGRLAAIAKYNIYTYLFKYPPRHMSHLLDYHRMVYIPTSTLRLYLTKSPDSKIPIGGAMLFKKGFLRKGDWDCSVHKIFPDFYEQDTSQSIRFRTIFQIFDCGLPYHESDYYMVQAKKKGKKNAEQWVERSRNLYHSMKKYGFKLQRELPRKMQKKALRKNDEIRVAIDRNGNFLRLMQHGNRRLAVAMILNIPYIPVFIQGVQYEWAMNCLKKHGMDILSAINKELGSINCQNK